MLGLSCTIPSPESKQWVVILNSKKVPFYFSCNQKQESNYDFHLPFSKHLVPYSPEKPETMLGEAKKWQKQFLAQQTHSVWGFVWCGDVCEYMSVEGRKRSGSLADSLRATILTLFVWVHLSASMQVSVCMCKSKVNLHKYRTFLHTAHV